MKSYEYNVLCPVCGFKYKNHQMKQRWDGLWVCPDDWETRNILDLYRAKNDSHELPFIFNEDGDGDTVIPVTIKDPQPFPDEISRGTYGVASGISFASGVTFPCKVYIYNGTVTKIVKNSIDQKFIFGIVYLEPSDTMAVTYSVAPKFVKYRV